MIAALIGDNNFQLRRELDALIKNFIAAYGDIAIERLDGESSVFERLQESLQSSPFLAEKKMVVLRSPSTNKQFGESIDRLLQGMPDTTDLVIVEPKIDKRSAYYRYLKKTVQVHEYTEPDTSGMAAWLVSAAKTGGGSLSAGDARFLVDRVGTNQQLLSRELEKLLIYDAHITKETIKLLTDSTPQSTIFELLDAAFAGNVAHALRIYREQRAQKVDVAQIIAMLTWQFKVLALIKTSKGRTAQEMALAAKVKPYTIQKSQSLAARLSLTQLRQRIADLLEIDVRLKRDRIDADEALQNFLLTLLDGTLNP